MTWEAARDMLWYTWWSVAVLMAYMALAGLTGWLLRKDSIRQGALTGSPAQIANELTWIQFCSWLWPVTAVVWPTVWLWDRGIKRMARKGPPWALAATLLAVPAIAQEPFDGVEDPPIVGELAGLPGEPARVAIVSDPKPSGNSVSILAGTVASTSGERSGITIPFVHVGAVVRLADPELAPRLRVDVDLTGIPGQQIDVEDPGTFRAVEFKAGVSQPFSRHVHFSAFAEFGSAVVLSREQGRAMKWAGAGLRVDPPGGSLAIGIAADQRLDGFYQPALLIYGGVRLHEQWGIGAWLVGSAVIGLVDYGRETPHDLVRVGVALGK
jgi:hypothetical protein